MTFAAAVIVVLGAATVFLGLLAHNLTGRLEQLEQAVSGGMVAPDRPLSREEFARRWRIATARADFARRATSGIYLFVDSESEASVPLLEVVAALPSTHDLTVISAGGASGGAHRGAGAAHQADVEDLAAELQVSTLPYVIVVDGARVTNAAPVGNPDMLVSLVREAAI